MKMNIASLGTALVAVCTLSFFIGSAPAQVGPGYALKFDGVNDWVSIQVPPGQEVGVIPSEGDFTVECWVLCPTAPNSVREVLSQGSSGNAFYIGTDSANNFRVGDSWTSTGIPFPLGGWHHVAVVNRTYPTGSTVLYVDGLVRGSLSRALANPAKLTGLRLGRQYGVAGEYWPGQIDEIRIWAVARSQADIQASMNRALSGSEPNLMAYWHCDENGGMLLDSGPYDYAGILTNGATWVLSGVPFVPEANTGPATNLSLTGATLTGTLNPGNLPTTAWFEWGTDTSYGNFTSAAILSETNASFALSARLDHLAAGVTYHFRLVGINSAGITPGSDATFTTAFPPSAVTLAASSIGVGQARLNGVVNPNGLPTTAWFEWGTDAGYGNVTAATSLSAGVGSQGVSAVLSNLAQGQTYHFRLAATNGVGVTFGNDQAFATVARPTISAIPDQSVSQGHSTGPISFTVADPDTPADNLTVQVHSANPVLVPNAPEALVAGGSGGQRTLEVVPVPEHSGSARITVTVSDGVASANAVFTVAVLPRAESPLLQLTSAERLPPQKLRFRFQDLGSGATNYTLDFVPDLSPSSVWTNASNVTITSLGAGMFQADLSPPPGIQGFFRVKSFRILAADFDTPSVDTSAGTSEVDLVIIFNAPYQGTLYYTVGGTAGLNDYAPLSGEVQINGTTAVIPVTLRNDVPTEFTRELILTLEGGPGFELGATRRTTVNLEENQADWQGAFASGQATLGFVMRMLQTGDGLAARFVNSGFSFFPTNELPVELVFTANSFAAAVANIPVSAGATLFNTPMWLTLELEAANGQTNQTVNAKRVQGVGRLISRVPAMPHLSMTNPGTFLLIKPPPPSPTNLVELVPAL